MPERSLFTNAVLKVAEEYDEMKRRAAESPDVPFMEEKLSLRDARNRFAKMTPEQRRQFIESKGLEEALRLARGDHATRG